MSPIWFKVLNLITNFPKNYLFSGDIRGHFYDLVRYIDFGGFPPRTSYLFLGNYISENEFSIETLTLILMLKVKFPENIFLLRGNRECDRYAEYSGFKNECNLFFYLVLFNLGKPSTGKRSGKRKRNKGQI